MVRKLEMRIGHFDFRHVAGHAQLRAYGTLKRRVLFYLCFLSIGEAAGRAFSVVKRCVALRRVVPVMTCRATHTRVINKVRRTVEDSIGLETQIVYSAAILQCSSLSRRSALRQALTLDYFEISINRRIQELVHLAARPVNLQILNLRRRTKSQNLARVMRREITSAARLQPAVLYAASLPCDKSADRCGITSGCDEL